MDVTAMQTALKRFGFDDNDPLLIWLNAAMHEFEDAADWAFLLKRVDIAVAAGDDSLALPADYFKTRSLRHSDGFKLKWRDYRDFDESIEDYTVQGTPSWYTTLGLNVAQFYPVADTAFTATLMYEAQLVDLVNPTDVPAIPTRYHYSGIVQLAAAIGLQAENEEERSTAARALANDTIARAATKYSTETIDEFSQVRDSQGYGD